MQHTTCDMKPATSVERATHNTQHATHNSLNPVRFVGLANELGAQVKRLRRIVRLDHVHCARGEELAVWQAPYNAKPV
jgi:hypothetical protein